MTTTFTPKSATSRRNASLTASRGELGTGVGSVACHRHLAPDRGHVDNRPAALDERGQECLRHRDVAEEVDVEQAAPLGERKRLHGRVDLDSGVVDEGAQRTAVGVVGDALHEHRDLGLVGDVESARLDIRGSDSVGVGIPTYAGEDVKAALGEFAGGGGADSRRGPGHHDERMTEGDVCLSQTKIDPRCWD